eukprot:scaffold117564_cov45-Prasinocladus_malaysianus.AAC.3
MLRWCRSWHPGHSATNDERPAHGLDHQPALQRRHPHGQPLCQDRHGDRQSSRDGGRREDAIPTPCTRSCQDHPGARGLCAGCNPYM